LGFEAEEAATCECSGWISLIVPKSSSKDIREENVDNNAKVFLIGIVGGGVQLGPLGTAATNRPIVPAPGDYDDGEIGGMMIGRGN
jgi:hypothetical protein